MSDTKDTYSYSLSPMQAGMLFQSLYSTNAGVDIEQIVCSFANVDPVILKQAWEEVWNAVEILRTGFDWQGLDQPMQRIHPGLELPWKHLDWRKQAGNPKDKLGEFLSQDRLEGFSLDQPPLMRLSLIDSDEDVFYLVWTFHHILLDGRAFPVIFRQMAEAYEAIARGEQVALPALRPYRDYITWLEEQDLSLAKGYWKELLRGVKKTVSLSLGRSQFPPIDSELEYGNRNIHLSAELTQSLRQLAEQHSLTLNTILQGAWAILLSRYSDSQDIIFGSIRTLRNSALNGEGMDEMIGPLINTLPVRAKINRQDTVLQVIKDLRAQTLQLRGSLYEHISLAEIQKMSELQPGSKLFDSILAFENSKLDEILKSQHGMLKTWGFELLEHVGYPLVVSAYAGKQAEISIEYNRDLFAADTAQQILEHLHTLLKSIAEDPFCLASRINILPEAERLKILREWNATQKEFPADVCIHTLFEEQVSKTPDAVALVFENDSITYNELNQRANRLAHYLQKQGVGPDILVGICMERSTELIVGLLAILKAGGAYLPMNPDYPSERLAFLAQDTRAPIVLTQKTINPRLRLDTAKIIYLDTEQQFFETEASTNPVSSVQPSNLVYAVYTSGSTGQAKGVLVNHANLVNAFWGWNDAYKLHEKPTVHLQMANFSFDVFSGDWTRALCSGGKLVICPHFVLLDPPLLYDLMQREKVDCAEFVPAVFRNLQLYLDDNQKKLDFMRILVVASDIWYVRESFQIQQLCGPQTRLINSYGITETTIDSTFFDCNQLEENGSLRIPKIQPSLRQMSENQEKNITQSEIPKAIVPIGKPFANIQIYILDSWLQPVPIGVIGELYIGGAGVARGYLNNPELTRERFVDDIFNPGKNARLYKTGDLARYLPDGNIEFLGRQDTQVKIRGIRIELGEIESILEKHPSVHQVVVVAQNDSTGQNRLVAYYTQQNKAQNRVINLHDYLKQKLPDYMIPGTFMELEAFPLNASGKINRRALPAPDFGPATNNLLPVSARTPLEHTLVEIWSNVLEIEQVGIHDNFFELGGHSLISTRLFAHIRKALGIELPLRLLFEAPTVAEMAERIENMLWAVQQPDQPEKNGKNDFEEITI